MRACPICSVEMKHQFDARGLPPGEKFAVLRCAGCGYGLSDPPVPEEEIGSWYPPDYYGKENVRFNPLFELLVRTFARRRARVITRKETQGAVLDVGCGRGFMLKTLRERGFTPYGVEITESGAWHARERLQIPVYVGHVTDAAAPFQKEQFEVIIFWHSLEHVVDAPATLRHAVSLLKPGGLLVVAVPNSDSLQARLSGPAWFHLDVPRHYTHFGARSLRLLLEQCGMRVVKADHFSAEQNPYGWLQSVLNALPFDFNFLYAAVKSKSARKMSRRQHPVQSLLHLLLVPPLLLFAGVMTVVEAAFRRGGTVEMYAIKGQSSPPSSSSSG